MLLMISISYHMDLHVILGTCVCVYEDFKEDSSESVCALKFSCQNLST